jgi:uncharacterized protein YjiS (DUF1127 family)
MRQIDQSFGLGTLWASLALGTSPTYGGAPVAPASRRRATPSVASRLRVARATVQRWRERAQGREWLLALDDRMLRDIGLTRLQAEAEAEKPFWRA